MYDLMRKINYRNTCSVLITTKRSSIYISFKTKFLTISNLNKSLIATSTRSDYILNNFVRSIDLLLFG